MIKIKLQQIRIKRNISQDDIARLISMTQPTYSRKERGKTDFTMSEWHNLAIILNVKLDDIYQDHKNFNIKENLNLHLSGPKAISIENVSVYKKQNSKLHEKIKILKEELKKARK